MATPKSALVARPEHAAAAQALAGVYEGGGWLDKAKDAQAKGTLADFFAQLMAQLGPLIGPIIAAVIAQLLHLPTKP
jgi:hypothetical protein